MITKAEILNAYKKVFFAKLTNNVRGKGFDVHGRSYRYTATKFGMSAMVNEFLSSNTWGVK